MEEWFGRLASYVALLLEAFAVILIAIGVCCTIPGLLRRPALFGGSLSDRKRVWVGCGVWLQLGLQFELAADVVRHRNLTDVGTNRTTGQHRAKPDVLELLPGEGH